MESLSWWGDKNLGTLTLFPGIPGKPEIPDVPFRPGKPCSLVEPGGPGLPISPFIVLGNPGAPGKPGSPGQPASPLSSGKETNSFEKHSGQEKICIPMHRCPRSQAGKVQARG